MLSSHSDSSLRSILVLRQLLSDPLGLDNLVQTDGRLLESLIHDSLLVNVRLLDLSDDGREMSVGSKRIDGSLSFDPSIDDVNDRVSDGKQQFDVM